MITHSSNDDSDRERSSSPIRGSWAAAVSDIFSPFSSAALALLPSPTEPMRYTGADAFTTINNDGRDPGFAIQHYHAINTIPPRLRVPKKTATPINVESKAWFANERTWVAWLNISILLGTLSLALFNASKDQIATNFAYAYALTSVGIIVYAFLLYQPGLR